MSELTTYWKNLTANHAKLPSKIFLLYDLLMERDPRKSGFSRITNPVKLANGQAEWSGLLEAKLDLQWALHDRNKLEPSNEAIKLLKVAQVEPSTISELLKQIR